MNTAYKLCYGTSSSYKQGFPFFRYNFIIIIFLKRTRFTTANNFILFYYFAKPQFLNH